MALSVIFNATKKALLSQYFPNFRFAVSWFQFQKKRRETIGKPEHFLKLKKDQHEEQNVITFFTCSFINCTIVCQNEIYYSRKNFTPTTKLTFLSFLFSPQHGKTMAEFKTAQRVVLDLSRNSCRLQMLPAEKLSFSRTKRDIWNWKTICSFKRTVNHAIQLKWKVDIFFSICNGSMYTCLAYSLAT